MEKYLLVGFVANLTFQKVEISNCQDCQLIAEKLLLVKAASMPLARKESRPTENT